MRGIIISQPCYLYPCTACLILDINKPCNIYFDLFQVHRWMKTPYQLSHHPLRTSNPWYMSTKGARVQTHWPTPPPRYQKHSPRQRYFSNSSSSQTFPALPACTFQKTQNLSFCSKTQTTASRAQPPLIWSCPAHAQCIWICVTVRIPDPLIQWAACPLASFRLTRMVTCTHRTACHRLRTHHAKWAKLRTHHAQRTSKVMDTPPPSPQPAWWGWPAVTSARN